MKALTFVEIDVDYCSLTYGVGACTATLSGPEPTGTRKCFNTKVTCQAKAAFANAPVTLRFAIGTAYLAESGIEAIACVEDVSMTPGSISLGENLGTRSSLTVTFSDHRWSDAGQGFDKYVAERPYDPFGQGTFWGKFRARQPSLRGRPIRLIRGFLGQTLAEMEPRHFIMESFDGPSRDGRYSITAKDALKMADGDRAQAPKLSNGFLVAPLSNSATTTTLSPAGIGNLEYPASGLVAIGGKEICSYTRSGDVLTLTRAQNNTEAVAHQAQDRVQVCLQYIGQDPAVIIRDLLVNFASVPASYIDLTAWQSETDSFLKRLYSAVIAEPTSVNTLVAELIQQAALAVWWDDVSRKIRLQVLRAISTAAARFGDSNVMTGSLRIAEQPDKRISQIWTYFGQINPLKKVDDADNYRSSALTVHLERQTDYGTPAIKRIYARWIPAFGRQVALRANAIQLGRFLDAPRKFSFDVFRSSTALIPTAGQGYRLEGQPMQIDTGGLEDVPIQITRLMPGDAKFVVEAEEMRFVEIDDGGGGDDGRVLIVDANTLNFNWRAAYDQIYPTPTEDDEIVCVVEAGVMVGSASIDVASFVVGDWPPGVSLTLRLFGRIQGKGGNGANAGGTAQKGGDALYTRYPITVESVNQIWGGGGGGGWVNAGMAGNLAGAGGAGYLPGSGGSDSSGNPPASNGTTEAGGDPGYITHGGGPGLPGGSPSPGGAGGAAGNAINGDSYVTFVGGTGDLRGPRIN